MINKKLTILEVCPYSAGSCGVFNRVWNEAKAFKEMGHDVIIFSSNATKGSKEIAPSEENRDGILIKRYAYKKLGGESFMKWDKQWIDDAMRLQPNFILSHNYRHIHTTQTLKIRDALIMDKINCSTILITHAPFIKDDSTRSFFSKTAVKLYDKFIGPKTLNKFDAIVRISTWEEPYLLALGADKNKIWKIPNVVPNEFFTTPSSPTIEHSILFLGRVAPIKNIEFILDLAKLMPEFNFSAIGNVDEEYFKLLNITHYPFPKNITFYPPVYDLVAKIKVIDSHKYFILPSHREALPNSMIEALSRGKICISTNTDGGKELINSNITGYICKNNALEEAKNFIMLNERSSLDKNKIIESVRNDYSIDMLKQKYTIIFEELLK
jgi:glycosyltransferase involved in cell wall biosynthesis